jgi:hypothetical protein
MLVLPHWYLIIPTSLHIPDGFECSSANPEKPVERDGGFYLRGYIFAKYALLSKLACLSSCRNDSISCGVKSLGPE